MIKAVFFDLDDTLISEREYTQSGLMAIATYLGLCYSISKFELYEELWNLYQTSPKKVFNRWFNFREIGYNEGKIHFLIDVFRKHNPVINFYPDVISTVKQLKSQGIEVGIITDGYKESQRKKIIALKATDFFDYIYITDEYGKDYWKPNTKIFEIIKEELKFSYDEIIYIGDNPKKDFHFKKSLGVKCFRIIRPNSVYQNEEYLEDVKEEAILDSLDEVLKYV